MSRLEDESPVIAVRSLNLQDNISSRLPADHQAVVLDMQSWLSPEWIPVAYHFCLAETPQISSVFYNENPTLTHHHSFLRNREYLNPQSALRSLNTPPNFSWRYDEGILRGLSLHRTSVGPFPCFDGSTFLDGKLGVIDIQINTHILYQNPKPVYDKNRIQVAIELAKS